MSSAPPFQTLGRYRVQSELGAGGMGTVYRAWDPQLARAVAIKVVKFASSETRARLVREAQSLARLSHPNVCHAYDVGTEGDEVWVAMELIEGATLRAWSANQSSDAVLQALLNAAEGIQAAHAAGLVHRDVKPENVLVTSVGRAVVTDFGLARIDDAVDVQAATRSSSDPHATVGTMSGSVQGTPAYLAPEQLTGAPVDARADQFAWAVMTWELLTGMRPFPIVHGARLDAIRVGLSPPAQLPRPLGEALVKAMAVAPRDRFASMRELIDAVSATRRSRSRLPLAIGGAVGVLAAAGGFLAVWKLGASDPPAPPPPPVAAIPVDAAAPVDASPRIAIVNPPRPPPTAPELKRRVAENLIESYCALTADPTKPEPDAIESRIVDWGTVTRAELVTGTAEDREQPMAMYEVKGLRATYKFDGAQSLDVLGLLDVKPGQLIALCLADSNASLEVPAAWKGYTRMTAFLPISRPPRIADHAKLAPIHITSTRISNDATHERPSVPAGRRALVRLPLKDAKVSGTRWSIDGWILEVPAGIPGHDLLADKRLRWILLENHELVAQPDGSKQTVWRAAAVIDDMFPP